jgi:hypothetical protein
VRNRELRNAIRRMTFIVAIFIIAFVIGQYALMPHLNPAILMMADACVGQTFLSAGSGDFLVARAAIDQEIEIL